MEGSPANNISAPKNPSDIGMTQGKYIRSTPTCPHRILDLPKFSQRYFVVDLSYSLLVSTKKKCKDRYKVEFGDLCKVYYKRKCIFIQINTRYLGSDGQ